MKLIKKVVVLVLIGLFTLTQISTTTYAISKTTTQAKVQTKKGIVTAKTLTVRKTASTKAKKLGTLKKNQSVTIYSSKNGWYQISYGKTRGWVLSKYIKITNKPKPTPPKTVDINMNGLYNINLIGKSLPDIAEIFIQKGTSQFKYVKTNQSNLDIYRGRGKELTVTAEYFYTGYKYGQNSVVRYVKYTFTNNKYSAQNWYDIYKETKKKLINFYGYGANWDDDYITVNDTYKKDKFKNLMLGYGEYLDYWKIDSYRTVKINLFKDTLGDNKVKMTVILETLTY